MKKNRGIKPMYLSTDQIKSLTERLKNLLGYLPKEAWVINLAFEIEISPKPFFSDGQLVQHYRKIERLHS
jgi:hypothetical protein